MKICQMQQCQHAATLFDLPCKGFEQLHSNAADLGKRMSDTISYDACLTF